MIKTARLLASCAPETATATEAWLSRLEVERRCSPHTLSAYRRDISQFFEFLRGHLGGAPALADLAGLRTADFRAFLAARRNDGIGSRTLSRQLSAIRSLFRHLERSGVLANPALALLRGPKRQSAVPKALPVAAACELLEAVAADPDALPWIAARDAAVLALLYGCGLRISESLALTPRHLPTSQGEPLRIAGKGGKQRIVPLLPAVRQAIEAYLALTRGRSTATARCSSAPGAAGSTPAPSSSSSSGCAAISDCRPMPRPMRCATASQPICSAPGRTCASSRSCSATPACRPPRPTPRSIAST
jgi:site-specific recombinase XerC